MIFCLPTRSPVNSPNKWPVTLKMFPFDDVIMCPSSLRCDQRHMTNWHLYYVLSIMEQLRLILFFLNIIQLLLCETAQTACWVSDLCHRSDWKEWSIFCKDDVRKPDWKLWPEKKSLLLNSFNCPLYRPNKPNGCILLIHQSDGTYVKVLVAVFSFNSSFRVTTKKTWNDADMLMRLHKLPCYGYCTGLENIDKYCLSKDAFNIHDSQLEIALRQPHALYHRIGLYSE